MILILALPQAQRKRVGRQLKPDLFAGQKKSFVEKKYYYLFSGDSSLEFSCKFMHCK